MNVKLLPEDCIAYIFSLTSPWDACRACPVSSDFRSVAESDAVWEKFLPSDYQEILQSSLVSSMVFSSKKELFLRLCNSVLIDGGKKIFSLEKCSGKKCYMLSAKELSITWSSHPLYWSWKPLLESRFKEVAELRTICWLEIQGKINTQMLSPKTTYEAYLIVKFANRAYGLNSLPSEVSIEVGNYKSQGTIYLCRPETESKKLTLERICLLHRVVTLRSRVVEGEEMVSRTREDGWIEIGLGKFYSDGSDQEVKMSLREVKGEHLKGGLIVEGIEIRPKGCEKEKGEIVRASLKKDGVVRRPNLKMDL